MRLPGGRRVRAAALVGLSNGVSLVASLAGLVLAARMVGAEGFAGYAVALAVQALCATITGAVGPVCGRILSANEGDAGCCRRFRWRSGLASGLVLVVAGMAMEASHASRAGMAVWVCLALQLPSGALEAHRLQILQMGGRFERWSLVQPLSRLARALALALGWLWGLEGVLAVVALQTLGQILANAPLLFPGPRMDQPRAETRFEWASAGWNTLSGAMVWGATRANLLVSNSRLGSGQTGLYGLAETLSSSLLVLNQSIMTLLQPAIYRWEPSHGIRPLARRALVAGGAGSVASVVAALVAPWALGLVLDPSWRGVEAPFAVFCAGSALQAWAAVAGAVLHRLRAGRTILFLELAGGIAMLGAMLWIPVGASASQAAWCWVLGRSVWAVGGLVAAGAGIRSALRPR